MRVLIITAVEEEARALGAIDDARVIVGGVGRTNAAAATTEAILRHEACEAVINIGIAGALPGTELAVGDVVVASRCVYCEEGLITRGGFVDVASFGLSLGDFEGNAVPVSPHLLERFGTVYPVGPIATVATCSGTDEAAEIVVRRTGAVAEAMEGAAVVHAARRLQVPAIEIRAVSNMTGERSRQSWDLESALDALGAAAARCLSLLRSEHG